MTFADGDEWDGAHVEMVAEMTQNRAGRRYQVFVSSTYEDLAEERQAVITGLLRLNCIPAGMELFPAASDDQWTLIRRVIDESDYFVVIVAGKYGSLAADGVSFTEKEYRYAVESGKPVLGLVVRDPEGIPARKTERREAMQAKLDAFRSLVLSKPCGFWTNPADLAGTVTTSLSHLIETHPADGWVRGSAVAPPDPSYAPRDALLAIRLVEDKVPSAPNEARIEQCQLYLWDNADADVLWVKLVLSAATPRRVPALYLAVSPPPLEVRDSSHMFFAMDSLLRSYQMPDLSRYGRDGSLSHVFYIAEPGKERERFHYAHPVHVPLHPSRAKVEGADHGTYRVVAADFLTYEPLAGESVCRAFGLWLSCTLPKLLSRTHGSLRFTFNTHVPVERFRIQVALPFGTSACHEDCLCCDTLFHPHLSTNPLISYPGWLPFVSPSGDPRDIPIFFNPTPGIAAVDGCLVYANVGCQERQAPPAHEVIQNELGPHQHEETRGVPTERSSEIP